MLSAGTKPPDSKHQDATPIGAFWNHPESSKSILMSYEKLKLTDLRNDAERVLLQNFPNTTLIAKGFPGKYSAWNPLRLF